MPVIMGRGTSCAESRPGANSSAANSQKSRKPAFRGPCASGRGRAPGKMGLTVMGGTCGFDFCDFGHALTETRFKTLIGGVIPRAADKVFGQALHVGGFFVVIVRVLIAFAVTEIFHEPGRRIAKVQRNGIGFGFLHVFVYCAESSVEGIGFWREGKINGDLRESQVALGLAEKIESVFCGERDGERAGFGETDI